MLPKNSDYLILFTFFSFSIYLLYYSPAIDITDVYDPEITGTPNSHQYDIPSWIRSFSPEHTKLFPNFQIKYEKPPLDMKALLDSDEYFIVDVPFNSEIHRCHVPTLESLIQQNRKTSQSLIQVDSFDQNQKAITRVQSIVSSTISQFSCIKYSSTYWKYSICFDSEILQYHEDSVNGKILRIENSLGEQPTNSWIQIKDYSTDLTDSTEKNLIQSKTETQIPTEHHNTNNNQESQQFSGNLISSPQTKTTQNQNQNPVFVQIFFNGSICDLTKKPRETVINWVCPPKGSQRMPTKSPSLSLTELFHKNINSNTLNKETDENEDSDSSSNQNQYHIVEPTILSISEVSTCRYVIEASIPAICDYPTISHTQTAKPTNYTVFCDPLDPLQTPQKEKIRIPNFSESINKDWAAFFNTYSASQEHKQ